MIGGHANAIVLDYEKLWERKKEAEYTIKATAWDGIAAPV